MDQAAALGGLFLWVRLEFGLAGFQQSPKRATPQ
jgi:hypothetical protein